ncbi:MAG TPA: hypothetical protein VKF40_15945 [Burkholderiales bacterium]|nr:hypothetical protein [Burkholderiales bacterium]
MALVRDSERGMEVLMLQRNFNSAFVPGAHVFPGGTVDDADHAAELYARCDGLDDAAASRVLGIARGGLAYWIAAIRELFEEAGVLLARDAAGALLALAERKTAERFHTYRKSIESGERPFGAIVAEEGLRLAADRLAYFGHWITPVGAVRRYDARFFVAVAPERQIAEHDNREAIAHEWARPADLLEGHERGERKLRTPTRHTLMRFAGFNSVSALVESLRAERDISAIMPRITREGRYVVPGEPGYEDAAGTEGRGMG